MRSPLAALVQWTLIDSTSAHSGLPIRAARGAGRLINFAWRTVNPRVDGVLIFSAAHLSFVEKGFMTLFAKVVRKRVVFCPRSGLLLEDLESSRLMRWFIPFILRKCDVVVCQGQSWARRFKAITGLPETRLVVIPNWIELTEAGKPFKRSKSKGTSFLILGRIEDYKGIFDLIEAVSRRRADLDGARFIVCGGGASEERAKARANALELESSFEFRGWIHGIEKESVLRASDALILPSHLEGMPNAVLEAMSYGLAVIATEVGGVPDIIVDGSLGVMVKAHDIDGLGDAIVDLHLNESKRTSLGAAGRTHVFKNHDVQVLWERFADILAPRRERLEVDKRAR